MKIKGTKISGIEVAGLNHGMPAINLPRWVKEQAEERGYGDSVNPLSLYITKDDIDTAFACAAQGNGSECVMAQAGKRIGAKSVYFYRKSAWVDFGTGPIVRFMTSSQIYHNIIEPFDRGDRNNIEPGLYHLTPPTNSNTLESGRNRGRGRKHPSGKSDGSRRVRAAAHTERVVMASRATE